MTLDGHALEHNIRPTGREAAYETAFSDAARRLREMDPMVIAENSGAESEARDGGRAIIVPFLRDEIAVTHPEVAVSFAKDGSAVPAWLRVLALHYLVNARGAAERGERIGFMQLEGGMGYHPAFQRRAVIPLLKAFGSDLEGFIRAGIAAGGVRDPSGDFALSFRAFPMVEVIFILWEGDGELSPSGTAVFDPSIAEYLSTEDVAVLCTMLAVSMMKAAR
jgi:hypothetical protein